MRTLSNEHAYLTGRGNKRLDGTKDFDEENALGVSIAVLFRWTQMHKIDGGHSMFISRNNCLFDRSSFNNH